MQCCNYVTSLPIPWKIIACFLKFLTFIYDVFINRQYKRDNSQFTNKRDFACANLKGFFFMLFNYLIFIIQVLISYCSYYLFLIHIYFYWSIKLFCIFLLLNNNHYYFKFTITCYFLLISNDGFDLKAIISKFEFGGRHF